MPSGAAFMAVYFVFYAAVHSILADQKVNRLARLSLGLGIEQWYRLAYVVLSSIMLLPFLYILVLMPGRILYRASYPLSWLMVAIQVLSVFGMAISLAETGVLHFFGISQLSSGGTPSKVEKRSKEKGLITTGFYCHLRNPLFLFGMIFLWSMPIMTSSLLIFNILATIYFYVGALHEERSLLSEFGANYRDYKQKVPMFMPRIGCP